MLLNLLLTINQAAKDGFTCKDFIAYMVNKMRKKYGIIDDDNIKEKCSEIKEIKIPSMKIGAD